MFPLPKGPREARGSPSCYVPTQATWSEDQSGRSGKSWILGLVLPAEPPLGVLVDQMG